MIVAGKVPLIFANMERAVNDYESALVKMSKKPNNGIFEKLGQYALSIFNQPNANKNNNGASASPSSGSAAARATAQTATQSSNSGSAKSRTQDKAATTAAIAAKKKVPIRLPNIIGRPSRLLEKKHIVEVTGGLGIVSWLCVCACVVMCVVMCVGVTAREK